MFLLWNQVSCQSPNNSAHTKPLRMSMYRVGTSKIFPGSVNLTKNDPITLQLHWNDGKNSTTTGKARIELISYMFKTWTQHRMYARLDRSVVYFCEISASHTRLCASLKLMC